MAKKVVFNVDYVGQHGSHKSGATRTISDEAFDDLKAKGIVNLFREPKTEAKELKPKAETKELKVTGKETK